jgi:hypothetical protein
MALRVVLTSKKAHDELIPRDAALYQSDSAKIFCG